MSTTPMQTNRSKNLEDVSLKCGTCGRLFTRNEHLKRHALIHSNDKPYQCTTCGREFVRKDALDRHIVTHEALATNLRRKGGRACSSCAAAKARCSGDVPRCLRCQKRGEAQCVYPDTTPASNVSDTIRPNIGTLMSSRVTNEIEMMPGMQGSTHAQGVGVSHTGVIPQPLYPEPVLTGQEAQLDWSDEFQSAINWISDEFPMFPDGFNFDDLNDNTLFPFPTASPGVGEEVDSPTLQQQQQQHQQQFVSPRRRLHSWGSSQVSPPQGSNISPSSQGTSFSARAQTNVRQHVEGELYVDGQPARLPRVKRRRLTPSPFANTPNQNGPFDLSFDLSHIVGATQPDMSLPQITYDQMLEAFNRVCVNQIYSQNSAPSPDVTRHLHVSSPFATNFESGFPSKVAFEAMVQSYITSFQPILPIIHVSGFHSLDWQLVLAVSVLGVRFVALEQAGAQFPSSLHEFLRRVLFLGEEDSTWLPRSLVSQAQMKLLFSISLAYTSTSQTWKSRHPTEYLPVSFCLDQWHYTNQSCDVSRPIEQRWEDWKNRETRIRLGNAVWLIDSLFAIHFQRRPLLTLENVPPTLPCHEEVWYAESADEWAETLSKSRSADSMKDALYDIYIKKQLPPQIGEFGRILLIHGLFHRMWQVQMYFKQPLSHWTPTAHRPSNDTQRVDAPDWLPGVPAFARWRNATCDCIDVLHWSANATIGAASGMEHPTVLHLHFSRIVLLTPYDCIASLAEYLAGMQTHLSEADNRARKQLIRRWAIQDQYKARLAMIHAGVLLWHVRRYSANGFYEPSSVAMATLALWAFSIFSEKPQLPPEETTSDATPTVDHDEGDEQEARCDIILLDRPTDDELVQQFVREGHRMRAILKGVGDLCSTNGPERVLIEGRKLLKTLTVWGIAEYWIGILDKLIAVSRRQREQQQCNISGRTS